MNKHSSDKATRIWNTVRLVPVGQVSSYGFIADLAGLPGCARMVAPALRRAPAELDLPWFRIVRSDGRLAFASGSEAARRQRDRLQAEGILVINSRVDMQRYRWQPGLDELMQMEY